VHALKGDEDENARIACGIVSDLCSNLKDKMAEYLKEFVECLITILKESKYDMHTKHAAIIALGDLCM